MELSEEQRSAVRWQWYLVAGTFILFLLGAVMTRLLNPYIRALNPVQGGYGLFSLFNCACSGLPILMIGILSVRYHVTLLGRLIKLSETAEDSRAVMLGWVAIVGGVLMLGNGLVLSFQSGTGLLIYLGCLLFVLITLAGIIYVLHRALEDRIHGTE